VQSFREISIGLLLAGGESARRNGGRREQRKWGRDGQMEIIAEWHVIAFDAD